MLFLLACLCELHRIRIVQAEMGLAGSRTSFSFPPNRKPSFLSAIFCICHHVCPLVHPILPVTAFGWQFLYRGCVFVVTVLPFVVVKFSGIISSSLGQTQTNIGNMFDYAKRTPCVLCIDEIDALGTMRGKKDDVAEMSRVVIALMQELDNIKNDVIVIGTTNRPDQLDEALIRRFVQRHEVKPLNQDDIRELVRKFNDSVGYPMDDIQMDVFCSQFGIEATANTVISACTERIIEKITEEVKQEQA